jgi:RNA polymerase sigma-70 factor (ECF subfamily)
MAEPDDQLLLQQFSIPEKRQEAFRQIMIKYQQRIYFHVRRMVIHHADADDVTQNTFIKVYQALPHFRGEATLFTWIYRIATNEALLFLKARQRRNHLSLEDHEFTLPGHADADPLLSGEKMHRKLLQAIDSLPDRQKMVFQMKYFDNMKYEEIASILGLSVGALKASFFHAVNKIEKYLSDD